MGPPFADLISSKGHQEELLHLEHVDGRHSDGRELHVINDEGGVVSAVVAGLDGLHIYHWWHSTDNSPVQQVTEDDGGDGSLVAQYRPLFQFNR